MLCLPCRSKAIFNTLEEEDIGIYSCLVTHTDGASSSYNLSEEGGLQSHKFQEVNVIKQLQFFAFYPIYESLFHIFVRVEKAAGGQS